jgi:hypothetical protein
LGRLSSGSKAADVARLLSKGGGWTETLNSAPEGESRDPLLLGLFLILRLSSRSTKGV